MGRTSLFMLELSFVTSKYLFFLQNFILSKNNSSKTITCNEIITLNSIIGCLNNAMSVKSTECLAVGDARSWRSHSGGSDKETVCLEIAIYKFQH